MSAPVIYISVPYSTIKNEKFILTEKEIGVNILIDSFEIDLPFLISYVHRFSCQFIYTISESITDDFHIRNIFSELYTLFCLSASYRNSVTSISVLSDQKKQNLPLLGELEEYFLLQGEKSITFAFFDPLLREQAVDSILLLDSTVLATFDESLFNRFSEWAPVIIIVSVSNASDIGGEISFINLLKSQNRYAKWAIEQSDLRRQANSLQRQCLLWKSRSELYHSFIGLSKKVGETQYYDILDWYDKEYESLPIWYKRFGHILKVITGKRTFRSLFNDNVKKYKD